MTRDLAIYALTTAVFLGGCASAPIVTSQVQAFHTLRTGERHTFSFMYLENQEQSLEFRTYQGIVRRKLAALGWREVAAGKAEVTVGFYYLIDNGRTETSSVPVWGQTGISSSQTTASVDLAGNVQATTTHTPTYGVKGYRSVNYTVYTRRIGLMMFSAGGQTTADGKPIPIYDGQVTSQGSTTSLPTVIPCMINALFYRFPGPTSRTQTLSQELQDDRCVERAPSP